MPAKKELSSEQDGDFVKVLQERFEKNIKRHRGIKWADVKARLDANPEKLWSLNEMETSGGEPDVVGFDQKTGEYIFYDCSAESPSGRRSICYDGKGQAAREKKGIHLNGNAVDMAKAMGIEILNDDEYRALQKLGDFDTKTSSWVKTPDEIRELGGAIFMDKRYKTVFLYHNGAESFYSARGFRGSLRV